MSYSNTQILVTSLNIDSGDLNKDIDRFVLHKLKDKYEDICTENGFIVKDSIKLINRNLGTINTINNSSYITYIVRYSADIINLNDGDEINIIVDRVNKMGVLGYISTKKNDFESSPIIIMVPNEYFDESTRDINSITKNQKINVVIMGCRVKYGHKKIQIVAKPK
tara:strand:- start:2067 stop:2564 length:498 start_codon:yes stop_codon:yes gene_type:complete